MALPAAESAFLQKRMRIVRMWRYLGPGLACLIAALGVWLFVRHPLLANPAYVLEELQRGRIDQRTIELNAVLLPIVICLLLFFCLVVVLFSLASLSVERKYLRIIGRYRDGHMPGA